MCTSIATVGSLWGEEFGSPPRYRIALDATLGSTPKDSACDDLIIQILHDAVLLTIFYGVD
jgi:hypothetical protein